MLTGETSRINVYPTTNAMTAFRTYFLSSEDPELSVSMRETRAMISDGTTGIHILIIQSN